MSELIETPELQIGQEVHVRFSGNGEEVSCLCRVLQIEDSGFWLTLPREGALLVSMKEGMRVRLTLIKNKNAIGTEVMVLGARHERLGSMFLVSAPLFWKPLIGRISPRIPTSIEAMIVREADIRSNQLSKTIPAVLTDLSASGARVLCRLPMTLYGSLLLQFQIPEIDVPITALCQVARLISGSKKSTSSSEFAVRFAKLSTAHSDILEKWVNLKAEENEQKSRTAAAA